MSQENLITAIEYLMEVNRNHAQMPDQIPSDLEEQKRFFRALLNITSPCELSEAYYEAEKAYLNDELRSKKLTNADDIEDVLFDNIYIWQGDITTLKADAIVNAANEQLLGCFVPLHNCIDNAIHSASGMKLRNACHELMKAQGTTEPTGKAKITPSFNLPSKYVIHTVGPIVHNELSAALEADLAASYRSCLEVAEKQGDIECIAFCSISTGVFRFPKKRASEIALQTIKAYMDEHESKIKKVIINVFSEEDYNVYIDSSSKYR